MAIEQFHYFTFGGVSSADYGIYISGNGVYNAPERAVELVDIPGRNGAVVLDNGRFEMVEVEYAAGVFGGSQADFRKAMSDFRNAILSQTGYQRLEDTYHPDEFREALYVSGLEADPVMMSTAAEFSMKFTCKPQRFLKSGEAKVSVASGGKITNPTPFDSGPVIEVTGYGSLDFGGYDISLTNEAMGYIELAYNYVGAFMIPTEYTVTGDAYRAGDATTTMVWRDRNGNDFVEVYNVTGVPASAVSVQNNTVVIDTFFAGFSGVIGTNKNTSKTIALDVETADGGRAHISATHQYRYRNDKIEVRLDSFSIGPVTGYTPPTISFSDKIEYTIASVSVMSTHTVLGSPTYIDCDMGAAYRMDGNKMVLLNQFINLGSDLPVLKPGETTITYDNTITKLEVVPRWWLV